jgi:hypothetical protein
MAKSARLLVLLLPAAAALAAPPASADEPAKSGDAAPASKPAENVPDDKAKEAIGRFQREFENQDLDLRLEAVGRLRKVIHPDVAKLLLDLAFKNDLVPVREAAFKGLALQKTSAKTVGPRVAKYLTDAAEENRKAKARGDYGLVIDVKTGEVDTTSDAGKKAHRARQERGRMLAQAVKVLDELAYRDRDGVDTLREFLTDGNDDLVAFVLGMLGKWKEWSVLDPDIKELFEMYPKEDEFSTGSTSVDTGSSGNEDSQAAKRKWMAKYGDPDRRRPRPKVVKAIQQAIFDITGEKIETKDDGKGGKIEAIDAYREFLKRPDIKRKIKAAR